MPERCPQVCRVKIMFELLPTICFVSTTTNSMKYLVNWIPLNTQVFFENTQPCLKTTSESLNPDDICFTNMWWMTLESLRFTFHHPISPNHCESLHHPISLWFTVIHKSQSNHYDSLHHPKSLRFAFHHHISPRCDPDISDIWRSLWGVCQGRLNVCRALLSVYNPDISDIRITALSTLKFLVCLYVHKYSWCASLYIDILNWIASPNMGCYD